MSSAKAALKAAKTALDAGRYSEAISQAETVLSGDPSNYFARLFLGRALEKQGKVEQAAEAYETAAKSKPQDTQAWLGLCSLYESQGSTKVDEYKNAAVKVAELYAEADDKHRCQVTIDKLVGFAKQKGTTAQIKQVLQVLLPGSPVFDYLEGRIPHPSHTFVRLAEITEDEEAQQIHTEVANRRTRIGARVGQVTTEVKREVFARSELEDIYRNIINWTSDDQLRREYEEKLLQRVNDSLIILPATQKEAKLDQALGLAEGMVIIHHPFQLAWDLVLESRDLDNLEDLDAGILHEYIKSFPASGLGKVIRAWLGSELSPFPLPSKDEQEQDDELINVHTPEDRLLLLTEGIDGAEKSPFAHRLAADYFLHLEEYQTAADTARDGNKALTIKGNELGMSLQNTRDALNGVLATALVHHETPRHHGEANRLFEDILKRKPMFTPALIGLGLIFEETEDFQDAINFLTKALQQDRGNVRVATELAWCKALYGDYNQALEELEALHPRIEARDPKSKDLKALVIYRIGICIWELDTSKTARRARDGAYARFLLAIKTNVNFAPAYTSLGIYYGDYAKDKKRARRCFQKAFELSSAETLAAERLARSFADKGEWDIVEVIAQRVIDSGRARPPPGSKRKGISWPYSALGVVQMNKLEYQQAIVSFLAAIRISPDQYQPYVGLGESYHNSGRYNSALRTFHYALAVHDDFDMKGLDETWFAKYMLANVHRELGVYDEAIDGLQQVLDGRKSEFGVLVSLLQTFVERSWHCIQTGLFGQAVESARQAIATASKVAEERPHAFNMWKALGDACSMFSWVQSGIHIFPTEDVKALVDLLSDEDAYNELADVDQVRKESLEAVGNAFDRPIMAAILAYKGAIHCTSNDKHAQAVAWYNLGWAEQRAFVCASTSPKQRKVYLKAGVRAFKRAIELEAGNAEFWNALGIVTTTLNPKVAQHSFVRSLHLNELNAKVWTNLGVLYMLQKDYQLAHQAFGRSQSTDPTYAHAWLGEGLIALMTGDAVEALNHFTHAFEISDASSAVTKRLYAQSSFDHLLSHPLKSNDLTTLIGPLFALQQLQSQCPADMPHKHFAALFFERVGNHAAAIEALTGECEAAEADYEASESEAALGRFAHAKSDLARNQLGAGNFAEAIENAETALDLSTDASSSGLDADACRKLRLSAHLTAGQAHFHACELGEAVRMFKQALEESDQDPDVTCLLVKVLWAQGGDDEKSVARDQLFECVEKHPDHVDAVTLLGAIAALDEDADTIQAVGDDLLTLRTNNRLCSAERANIESLLAALAHLSSDGVESDATALATAQANVVLHPGQPEPWSELEDLTADEHVAQMALMAAEKAIPPFGDMEVGALAKAFAGAKTAGQAQTAIALAPWCQYGWDAFAEVVGSLQN